MLVPRMFSGKVRRHGTQVLDRLAGDAFADLQAHLPEGGVREADVASHDELVPLAFEEIQRAHVRFEDGGRSLRRFIEEGHEGHGPRCEGHEVEHRLEASLASVDARLQRLAVGVGDAGHRGALS